MEKCCASWIKGCEGEVKRYEIRSGENTPFPNRYWGVSNYCEECAWGELEAGFVLAEVGKEFELVTL